MQRVAIARALIVVPKILVADEPTGNLDRATGESIIELFKRLAADKGLAVLITTHNMAFAYEADRAITLEDGRIVKEEDLRTATSLTRVAAAELQPHT
jgi:ABC-type lipoprotein export system ATPase subunit